MTHATPELALTAIGKGELVVLVDDVDGDNEGHLIFAAETATPEKVGFMVRHSNGVIRAALPESRATELQVPRADNDTFDAQRSTPACSVTYKRGTTSGISTADRAVTLRALANPRIEASEFARPGHVFPRGAVNGGVLSRASQTEAAVDMARLAGLKPSGVLCTLVEEDGSVAKSTSLQRFARRHGLLLTSLSDLLAHRSRTERWVVAVAESALPTRHGTFTARVYRSQLDGLEHVALFMGNVRGADDIPVRVHSECITSEVFGSLRCDCHDQLEAALASIAQSGHGVFVYLRGHEGRGIGLTNKIRAYSLQDGGADTVQANVSLGLPVDARRYDVAGHILRDLAPRSVRLMSNNLEKFEVLESYGIAITRRVRLKTHVSAHNHAYLRSKQEKLGQDLMLPETDAAAVLPPSSPPSRRALQQVS